MPLPDPELPRREYLRRLVATGGVAALAGCAGGDGGGSDPTGGDDGDSDPTEDVDEELVLSGGVVLNTAFPVRLADPDTGDVVADVHYHPEFSHWHQMPLPVPEGERVRYTVVVRDRDDQRVPLGPDGELAVEVEPAAETPRDIVDIEVTDEHLDLRGLRPGSGDFVFALVDDGERVWQGSLLSVRVED